MRTEVKEPLIIDMAPALAPQSQRSKPRFVRAQGASLILLLAVLIFGPLAFGATEPWSQFLQRTATIALFLLWVVWQHFEDSVQFFPSAISRPMLVFAVLVFLQLVIDGTAYRYATLSESLNLMTYAIMALLAGELFRHRRTLRTFVITMGTFGACLSIISVLQGLSGTSSIYWLRRVDVLSASIYGPYVNHNHYAGLMEMLIPLAAAAALMQRGPQRILLLFSTAIMVSSVALSLSRGGMIALAAEVAFLCVVLFRMLRNRRTVLVFLGVAAAVAVFVLALGSDRVVQRMTETQDAYRLKIYGDSLRMAVHKPVLGYGLGTFPDVYPAFRSFYGDTFVNHAHNDYLELLVETGLVGLALFAWFLYGVFRTGLAKATDRDDPEGRLLTLAVLTGVVGIAVHSLLDFNLHIPANAALFFVLCATAAAPFKHRIKPAQFQPWSASEDDWDEVPST